MSLAICADPMGGTRSEHHPHRAGEGAAHITAPASRPPAFPRSWAGRGIWARRQVWRNIYLGFCLEKADNEKRATHSCRSVGAYLRSSAYE